MWASYGGMNFINFNKKNINIKKLSISKNNKKKLSNNLILFFTGEEMNSQDKLKKTKHLE